MKQRPERQSYSRGLKLLHWTIAVIVLMMLAVSFFLGNVPKNYQGTAYLIHKSFGLTVLLLMIIRIIWLCFDVKPALPASVPRWEVKFAHAVQYSFYIFLLLMPLCGWILSVASNRIPSYFGLFQLPLPIAPNKFLANVMDNAHKTIAWILIALVCLHIAGALKHHFIDRDNVLSRMLPRLK